MRIRRRAAMALEPVSGAADPITTSRTATVSRGTKHRRFDHVALRTHEDVSARSLMKEVLEMDNLMVERNIKEIGAKLVIPYNKTIISFGVSVGEEFCVI